MSTSPIERRLLEQLPPGFHNLFNELMEEIQHKQSKLLETTRASYERVIEANEKTLQSLRKEGQSARRELLQVQAAFAQLQVTSEAKEKSLIDSNIFLKSALETSEGKVRQLEQELDSSKKEVQLLRQIAKEKEKLEKLIKPLTDRVSIAERCLSFVNRMLAQRYSDISPAEACLDELRRERAGEPKEPGSIEELLHPFNGEPKMIYHTCCGCGHDCDDFHEPGERCPQERKIPNLNYYAYQMALYEIQLEFAATQKA